MEKGKSTVLIVEDQALNRQILRHILETEYAVVEASNGREALDMLQRDSGIAAILLDIFMPVMDGYVFLQELAASDYATLPVIVITGEKDQAAEQKALNLGAWDFVSKPYQANILLLRLKNVIVRSQYYLLSEMQYAYEHDALTDLCNRTRFFADTRSLLNDHPDISFVLIHFDIRNFHTYNSYWGEEEGNRLLRSIADFMRQLAKRFDPCTYARINADNFCLCAPYNAEALKKLTEQVRVELAAYNHSYLIEPAFGLYLVTDPQEKIESMLEKAALAAKTCKSHLPLLPCYYRPGMSDTLLREQRIVNEMQQALDEEQFLVYLQPKYSLSTELPYGAEALIRWKHPERGLVPPGEFIPVFERNGFIGKVDFYMWEKVCALLRSWIDAGLDPAPISVNMSRVNLYNPNLVAFLTGLLQKYDVPPRLLHLELTESAYMENPSVMEKTIRTLQKAGFVILMDDFGSGYSSLNTLKNVPVDILKIDMKFLAGEDSDGRNECILASVIRMAGWLNLPVIMEGVETIEQVEFLKSVGCGYVQGYYFARPMPVAEYEALIRGPRAQPAVSLSENHQALVSTVWSSSTEISLLFNSIPQPAAVYSLQNGHFCTLRTNMAFSDTFGYSSKPDELDQIAGSLQLSAETRQALRAAFAQSADTHRSVSCDFDAVRTDGRPCALRLLLQYWGSNEKDAVLFALFAPRA